MPKLLGEAGVDYKKSPRKGQMRRDATQLLAGGLKALGLSPDELPALSKGDGREAIIAYHMFFRKQLVD